MPSPRLPFWRRWFGSRSENAARRFLQKLGYRIVTGNFSCPFGEIDLIALDQDCLVFVEVRSTERAEQLAAAASVDAAKQSRLTRLALYYLKRKRLLEQSARFDVITVSWPAGQKEPALTHYRNAFEATGKFQFFR